MNYMQLMLRIIKLNFFKKKNFLEKSLDKKKHFIEKSLDKKKTF